MVVDDLDVPSMSFVPTETDSPLSIYADRMLTAAVASQCLQPIGRWHVQGLQPRRGIHLQKLSQALPLEIRTEFLRRRPRKERLGMPAREASYHD
jgi:hypothetical protein